MQKLDVVILSWNRTELTLETVESIQNQAGVRPIFWIIDQGSEPECINRLRILEDRHENIHLYESNRNLGVAGGRNLGMRLGKEGFIVCIDNDAIFHSHNELKKAIQRFDNRHDIGAVGFRLINYFTGEDDLDWWVYPKSQWDMRDQGFFTTRFPGGAHVIRREIFEKTRGYDERLFFYWEEVDLSNQIINLGYKIQYDPSIIVLHKTSPEGRVLWTENRYYYYTRNALYLRMKYYRSPKDFLSYSMGYLLKGARNNVTGQAIRGINDAVKMIIHSWSIISNDEYRLSDRARKYIAEHEDRYRGNIWQRLKSEVLVKVSQEE
jgi:GT2 family glycosyltransferase